MGTNQSFLEFMHDKVGPIWSLTGSLSRPGRDNVIISIDEWNNCQRDYLEAGGNPDDVGSEVAQKCGFKKVWVRNTAPINETSAMVPSQHCP